jgi:hypothetical protein
MKIALKVVTAVTFLLASAGVRAGVVTYHDIDAFREAAGDLVEIDFDTLPDGSPSPDFTTVDLTPEFNYTDWGVTFSSPVPRLYIVGSTGHALVAISNKSSIRNWIEADFEPPVYALGVMTLAPVAIFGLDNSFLGEFGSAGFIGMISEEPIDLAVIDTNDDGVNVSGFLFRPVPEPASLLLLIAGAFAVARRR